MKERNLKPTAEGFGGTREATRTTRRLKTYVKPEIVSCSAEELLDQLGSARACSHAGSVMCPQLPQ